MQNSPFTLHYLMALTVVLIPGAFAPPPAEGVGALHAIVQKYSASATQPQTQSTAPIPPWESDLHQFLGLTRVDLEQRFIHFVRSTITYSDLEKDITKFHIPQYTVVHTENGMALQESHGANIFSLKDLGEMYSQFIKHYIEPLLGRSLQSLIWQDPNYVWIIYGYCQQVRTKWHRFIFEDLPNMRKLLIDQLTTTLTSTNIVGLQETKASATNLHALPLKFLTNDSLKPVFVSTLGQPL